jgi:glucosamine-6-phosphate deaminase
MDRQHLLELTRLPVEELRRRARTRFRLVRDVPALLEDFADSILREVLEAQARGEPARLILPVGPVGQYRRVVERTNREGISWKHVHVFAMDEFLDWQGRPIAADHPLSFRGFLERELFGRIDGALGVPQQQRWYPHPFRIDEISEAIERAGGVDCCFGGIGYHGHVAFNEPPISRWFQISVDELRNSSTRVLMLGDDSIIVQSIHSSGGNSAEIPPMAVTLGMRDILASRRIRLYCAAGERHRTIFRISVAGEVTTDYPSTLVQGHPDAEIVIDEPSAQPIEPGLR